MIATLSVTFPVALVLFIIWELTRAKPVMDLRMFKNRNFAAAAAMIFAFGLELYGMTVFTPQYVQAYMGYDAELAGMTQMPGALLLILLMPVVGRLVRKIEARWLIAAGFLLSALALFHVTTNLDLQIDFYTAASLIVAGDRAKKSLHCTQKFHATNIHIKPRSAVLVPKLTLTTHFRGSLPYIFPELLPLPHIEQLSRRMSAPSVKQHLACIRMLFDWLVTGQVVPVNPAHSVRGPRYSVNKGVTPVLSSEEATALLAGMDVSSVVGLRDRAIIAVMTYTFARVGAVIALNVEDYYSEKKRWWLRLHEKNGKLNEMPCHHKLEQFLDAHIEEVPHRGRHVLAASPNEERSGRRTLLRNLLSPCTHIMMSAAAG